MNALLFILLISSGMLHAFTFESNKKDGIFAPAFIKELCDTFHPDVFFETGTFNGKNARLVASYIDHVHTVELSDVMYRQARSSLAHVKNVSLYRGSSPEIITQVATQLEGHVMFWLDAHYSGGDTALNSDDISDPDGVTAIRNELRAIKDADITDCTILIDDVRGFGAEINDTEFLGCWAYPSIQEVCRMAKEINPNFAFALLGDILMIYDAQKYRPAFSSVVCACTQSRLYDGYNLIDEQLLAHERIIMHAQGKEKAFIKDLYRRMTDYKDPMFHHDLWYGLVSIGEGNWQEAAVALKKVPNRVEYLDKRRATVHTPRTYQHWRIDQYLADVRRHLK